MKLDNVKQQAIAEVAKELLALSPLDEALQKYKENPEEYDALEVFLQQLHQEKPIDANQLLAQIADKDARERTRRRFNVVRMIKSYHQATQA